jgi:Tol biopolymer transport system component
VPSWSPDGGQLLYSLNVDSEGVFLYDLETDRTERLDQPTERGAGCRAAWSPDGRYIAYQSSRDLVLPDLQQMMRMDQNAREAFRLSFGFYDLYVMDLRTRTHRRLTTQSGGHPVWSPDGQWIIYYAPGRQGRLYRIRPDGSGDEEFLRFTDPQLRARVITWSPDGKRMAFSTWFVPPDFNTMPKEESQVYTADAAGGDRTLLTSDTWTIAAPAWSPRSDRIALVVNSREGSSTASIRLVENGTSREVVAEAYWDDLYNVWSPNGRAIAYSPLNWSTLEGRGISILDLDSGEVRRVASDRLCAYPGWRPRSH